MIAGFCIAMVLAIFLYLILSFVRDCLRAAAESLDLIRTRRPVTRETPEPTRLRLIHGVYDQDRSRGQERGADA